MRAAVLHGRRDLRLEDRPVPVPGSGEVLIQVRFNGLCGTDLHEYTHGPDMVPLDLRHPGSGHVGPTILGHEFVGRVVAVGSGAEHLEGARVACGAGVACGACRWCRAGRTNLCADYYTLGLHTHGGLAEFVVAPATICVRVPDECTDVDAALAQPLAVALHAIERAEVPDGATVLLLGAGAIGSFIAAGLRDRRCRVVAADVDERQLRALAALGVDDTLVIDPEADGASLRGLLPGGGDIVFETSGARGSTARAAALARRGGRVVLVGLAGSQQVPVTDLVLVEVDLRTTVAHVCDHDLPAALELLRSWPLSESLVGDVIPLERIVKDGFEALRARTVRGKVLVKITSGGDAQ